MKQCMKNYGKIMLKGSVSILLVGWLINTIEWGQILMLIQNAGLSWIAVAFIWVILSVLVSAHKWQLICRASGLKLPLKVLWNIYWAGLFFNNFMPSSMGGDALRIYWAGKYAGDTPGAGTSVVVERLLATIGLALLGIIAAPLVNTEIPYLYIFFVIIIIVTFMLMGLILSPAFFLVMSKIFASFPKVTDLLDKLSIHGVRLRKQKGYLAKALIWSLVFQFCVVMVNYSLFQAFHISQITLCQACFVIPATSVAAMIPVGINGYGTREGAYVFLFAYFGVARAAAIAVSIIFALIVSLASLWGGWIWLRNGQKIKEVQINDETNDGREGRQVLCRG